MIVNRGENDRRTHHNPPIETPSPNGYDDVGPNTLEDFTPAHNETIRMTSSSCRFQIFLVLFLIRSVLLLLLLLTLPTTTTTVLSTSPLPLLPDPPKCPSPQPQTLLIRHLLDRIALTRRA